jgi:hypothetical protein
MIVAKLLETTLQIAPDEVFGGEALIMNKLSRQFVGKCFSQAYIIEIIKIIKSGEIRMDTNAIDGGATFDVLFEANTIIYSPGEIIVAPIGRIDPNATALLSLDNVIIIANIEEIKSYELGMQLPVMVNTAKYPPMAPKIIVNADPLVKWPLETYQWHVTGSLDKSAYKQLLTYCEQIEDKLSQLPQDIVSFFAEMLGITFEKGKKLTSIEKFETHYVTYSEQYPDSIIFEKSSGHDFATFDANYVFATMVSSYYKTLNSIYALANVYKTPELLSAFKETDIYKAFAK